MHHPGNFFMFSPANLQRSHLRVKPSPDMPGVEDSSKRAVPLFKFSMPFHLAIQIVCTHHWSARNCWWTPPHCTRHYLAPCILGNQDPCRMSEGDKSDGILGGLLIRTLDDTRRYSWKIAISWWSCLATSRWWWIYHISQIHFARCWRLFQKSRASVQILHALSPFLLIQIVCTHHWSARNCWWTPPHCTRHYLAPCILGNQDRFRMSEGDESDGILGGLLIRTLDYTRYSSNLALQICWNSGHNWVAFLKGVTTLQPHRSCLKWTHQCPNNTANNKLQ